MRRAAVPARLRGQLPAEWSGRRATAPSPSPSRRAQAQCADNHLRLNEAQGVIDQHLPAERNTAVDVRLTSPDKHQRRAGDQEITATEQDVVQILAALDGYCASTRGNRNDVTYRGVRIAPIDAADVGALPVRTIEDDRLPRLRTTNP